MRGKTKNIAICGAASLALLVAGPALAADAPVITKAPMKAVTPPPPVFELAYGASISTDYNFRGVSQSNRDWSFGGYLEARINNPAGQFYLGVAGWRIEWPGPAAPFGFTDPSAEVDFIGGWRKTWDKFGVDIGAIYYYYPGETFNGFTSDSDFWEVYWKGTYAVNDMFTVGANVFYSPDVLNYSESFGNLGGGFATSTKARGLYGSLTAAYTFYQKDDWKAVASGELGHWWLKDNGFIAAGLSNGIGPVNPDYTYWNAGLAFTYKTVTLDLRYHGTDQGRTGCSSFLLIAAVNPASSWCKDAYIATLKFDNTWSR
jgi:uncharacterized protein (TIGR02001 family)